jgi:hypothetical protein
MKKAFRALSALTVEKMFLADAAPIPAGWHATTREALDSYAPAAVESPQSGTVAATDTAPKRGRPRKVV